MDNMKVENFWLKTILAALIVLLAVILIDAQTEISSEEAAAQRLVALEAQVTMLRENNDKILNTVYWSLSFVGGVVLLVIGLGWYTNFRIYRSDLAELKREVADGLAGIEKAARESASTSARDAADAAIAAVRRDVKRINYDLYAGRVSDSIDKRVFKSAIRYLTKKIEIGSELGYGYRLSEDIKQVAEIFKTNHVGLDPEDTGGLESALALVSKTYPTDVEAIKDLLRQDKLK